MALDQTWWKDAQAPFPTSNQLELTDTLQSILAACPFFERQALTVLQVLLAHAELPEGHRSYISKHQEQTFAWFPEGPRKWVVELLERMKKDPEGVWEEMQQAHTRHRRRSLPDEALGQMTQALSDSSQRMRLPSSGEDQAVGDPPKTPDPSKSATGILPAELRAKLRQMRESAKGAEEAGERLRRRREQRESSSSEGSED